MTGNVTADSSDLRDIKTCLTLESFLAIRSCDATLKLVLKRGTVFSGGLTGRPSLLPETLPGVAHHA